jgi:hypothetical protein
MTPTEIPVPDRGDAPGAKDQIGLGMNDVLSPAS